MSQIPLVDTAVHHTPRDLRDRFALGFTKLLRFCADTFFAKRYGHRAIVLETVSHHAPGRVKIGGEVWTAKPYDEDDQIETGETVDAVSIKGATAYVLRTHQLGS